MNYIQGILCENCNTFAERREVLALRESELQDVTANLLNKLFKSTLEKSHIDFGDIPETKGNINRYNGLKEMIATLDIMQKLCDDKLVNLKEIEMVRFAIGTLQSHRDLFEKGFKLRKEFVMMTYNVMVKTCVEATSALVSSYIDYVKNPEGITITISTDNKKGYKLLFDSLGKFGMSAKSGDLRKALNAVLNEDKGNFTGAEIAFGIGIGIAAITALTAIVPILRELVFTYYYTRMKLSDSLKQLALFTEVNKKSVELSGSLPAKKRNEVIRKQEEIIKQLMKISDAIRVDYAVASNKVADGIKAENKNWSLGSIKSDIVGSQGLALL